jgi:hypothetical protein
MSRIVKPGGLSNRRAVTLVEILIALIIMALAILPAIGAFSTSYGTATRQIEQETALKIGEATVNVLLSVNYEKIVSGTLGSVPLNIQTPAGMFNGSLVFDGMLASSTSVNIGRASYQVNARVQTLFRAQNIDVPHNDALVFSFQNFDLPPGAPPPVPVGPGPVPPAPVATYSCFDDLVCIKVKVDYGQREPVELETFRADMSR